MNELLYIQSKINSNQTNYMNFLKFSFENNNFETSDNKMLMKTQNHRKRQL